MGGSLFALSHSFVDGATDSHYMLAQGESICFW